MKYIITSLIIGIVLVFVMAKKDKKGKSKKYKVMIALVNLGALAIISCGVVADVFWLQNIESELLYVSIDSFLALVGIVSSFLLPYAENKTYKKYNLLDEDLVNINGNSKILDINLLVAAIIILVADAVFYTIEFAATLIAIILVCVLYIGFFIAPRLFEYIRGDADIINSASKWYNQYLENPSPEFDSYKKLIVSILLDKGFENTIISLKTAKCNKKKILGDTYEKDLFAFLVVEQANYFNNISTNPHIREILTSTITREVIINYSYVCSTKCSARINSLDEDNKHKVFQGVCDGLLLLSNLIYDDDLKKEFQDKVFHMLVDLLHQTYLIGPQTNEVYLLFLDYIFINCLNFENVWFIEVFSELCNKNHLLNNINQRSYLIMMYFVLISYYCDSNRQDDDELIKEQVTDILINRTKPIGKQIEKYNDEVGCRSIYHTYVDCKKVVRNVRSNGKNHNIHEGFTHVFFFMLEPCLFYVIPISYYNEIEKIDDLMDRLNEEEKKFVVSVGEANNFGVWRYCQDLQKFITQINKLDILSFKIDYEVFFQRLSFIHAYGDRVDSIERLKSHIGFDAYLSDFRAFEQNCTGYVKDSHSLTEKPQTRLFKDPYRVSFYISKNATVSDLEAESSPLHIESLLSAVLHHAFVESIDSGPLISYYGEKLVCDVIEFKPRYKKAPHFDEYCQKNNITLENCTDLDWFSHGKGAETFVQEGMIKHNIQGFDIGMRCVTTRQAISISGEIINRHGTEPMILPNSSFVGFGHSDKDMNDHIDLIKKVMDEYYYVTFEVNDFKYVYCDRKKMLVYYFNEP